MSDIGAIIREIKADTKSGASELSRKAAYAMGVAAENFNGEQEFLEYLKRIGRRVADAQPHMSAIRNCVAEIVYNASNISSEHGIIAQIEIVKASTEDFIERSKQNVQEISEHALDIIADGDSILTHSYSSTVVSALKHADREGRKIDVFINQSDRYGSRTTKELMDDKIKVTLFSDEHIEKCMSDVDSVIVGADSILKDGTVINAAGTCKISELAKENAKYVYSLCETTKFDPSRTIETFDVKKAGHAFDATPSRLVQAVVTELGLMNTGDINKQMKLIEKYYESLEESIPIL